MASILVGADDLAPGAGREGLVDPRGGPGREQAGRGIVRDVRGRAIARVVGPGVDRLLEEADRAVEEGEVTTAGMEARRGDREVVLLGIVAVEVVAVGVLTDPA